MILFFYGEETFRSSQKILQLKKKFLEKNPTGGGLLEFDCNEQCNVTEIIQSFGEQNLFAQKKLIIIKDFFVNISSEKQKEIQKKLKGNNEDVIVFFETNKVRKNAFLFKWLVKNSDKSEESKLLEGIELEKWITKTVEQNDKKIDNLAVIELILLVENDLWRLSTEVEKLICYADGREISIEDVHFLVRGRVDADMFQTVEAIVGDDKGTALTLLKKQLASGDDAFRIFGMYAYQIRTLLMISGMVQDGVCDKIAIAKTLGMHPFVVQKSLAMLRETTHEKVKKMHKHLTLLDSDVKQGKRDIATALDVFVLGK